VAILSENRAEWPVADFGALMLGTVVVPIYATLLPDQIAHILRDSGARVLFLSTVEQLKKFLAIKDQTRVEKAVIMDYAGITEAIPMHRLMHAGPPDRDPEFDRQTAAIAPEDLATIIYTSGTTGVPKGAMLSHGNLASNVEASTGILPFHPGQVMISFLPLAHITARHVDYVALATGTTLAYCSHFERLPEMLQEVRPTLFVGVPRVYEKMYAQVVQRTRTGGKKAIYRWALKTGRAHRTEVLDDKRPSSPAWRIANLLVFKKLRQRLGGRIQVFFSGGAPLGRELAEWYADMGIRIDQGYGLTETSPIIAVNGPHAHKLGTVGKPYSNFEVRIAEDGEILVRGPSVFQGYWNMPEQTASAFEDGWFKTGDLGHLDEDGFLVVTDRKKDLLKTSGGKFITPQPIEKSLQLNPLVAEAVVLGDRRKFPCVIIAPNFPILEDWARNHGVGFSSREELVSHPQVRALYDSIVADVNQRLAQYERLKKLLLVSQEFSIAAGTLTPTMKLRRRKVEECYRAEIERLYGEPVAVTSE
jgi:long-chain acyl-CoA synthetase